MNKNFYITTTTPYVNADPHIGHALEFIQADVIARYQRQKLGKENVLFNLGTDEHGLKMYTKAQEAGQTPQEYVDHFAARWRDFCDQFLISFDSFYRTSDKKHHLAAQKFWEESLAAGDIYKKHYEGLYCIGHESFITDKELVNGKCPEHGTEPITVSEENYFFRLSKYKDALIKYYEDNPEILLPKHRRNELRNWIENMEDISISRIKKNLPWGIDVPNDPDQVIYVWFDALVNYIAAIGYPDDKSNFEKWWPVVQVFGPDNLRFQCAIWQGMLASVGLPFTRKFLCHGMVLAEDGTKMSKTKGNTVSPLEQADKFGVEPVRYYVISGIATYGDSAYKESDLINSYNSHLANNYGNLLNRVLFLAAKLGVNVQELSSLNSKFTEEVEEYVARAEKHYEEFELQEAVQVANELATFGNKYIDDQKPWDKEMLLGKATEVLHNLIYLLGKLTDLYAPILPDSAAKAKAALESGEKVILFPKLD